MAECPGLLAENASSVQWCTVPPSVSTNRYKLFREDDPSLACNGTVSTFQVDYLSGGIDLDDPKLHWRRPYPTVTVALPIDVSTGTTAEGQYDLHDQIALRNATACT